MALALTGTSARLQDYANSFFCQRARRARLIRI